MNLNDKTVLLLSGGIDSYVGYHILRSAPNVINRIPIDFDTMYFDLNLPYSNAEISVVKEHCDSDIKIVDLTALGLGQIDPIGGFIPNRNLLFFTLASAFGYRNILVCANKEDRIQDNTQGFHDLSSQILSESLEAEVNVISPVASFTKFELCQMYIDEELGVPLDLAFKTFSCYNPVNITEECLSCKACFRKNTTLHKLGLTRPFNNKELVLNYLKDSSIPKERMSDINDYASKLGIRI